MDGRRTDLSVSPTAAFTESGPPKLESVVIRGFSYSSRVTPSGISLDRGCIMTPRGWSLHGTYGRWRVGGAVHPSPM